MVIDPIGNLSKDESGLLGLTNSGGMNSTTVLHLGGRGMSTRNSGIGGRLANVSRGNNKVRPMTAGQRRNTGGGHSRFASNPN